MLNKVVLQGNVGNAPEIRLTQDGRKIAVFSLATSSSWKDALGEWQTCTDWHRVIVFRESTVGWLKDILKKGDSVYVEGRLSYHPWADKYNQKRSTPYVVVSGQADKIAHIRHSTKHPIHPQMVEDRKAYQALEDESPPCTAKTTPQLTQEVKTSIKRENPPVDSLENNFPEDNPQLSENHQPYQNHEQVKIKLKRNDQSICDHQVLEIHDSQANLKGGNPKI